MKLLKLTSLAFLLLAITNCGGKKDSYNTEHMMTEKEMSSAIPANWARPGAEGRMSAAFFTYTNPLNIADTLTAIWCAEAGMTQMHESYTTEEGLAGMRERKELVVAPGETIVFQKGGLHTMLMKLRQDIAEGDSVHLELNFAKAGKKAITVPVLAN